MLLKGLWIGKFNQCLTYEDILVSRTLGEARAGIEQCTPTFERIEVLDKAF